MMIRALLGLGILTGVAAVVAAAACGGSESSNGGGGGGAYCSALSQFAQMCGRNDPCTMAEVRDCSMIAGNLSTAAQNAAAQCESSGQVMCPMDGGTNNSSCLTNALASAQPSAAQQKLAQDYCNVCAAPMNETVAACTTAFYQNADGGGTSGYLFLLYNDDIVTKVDQTCVAGLSSDGGAFGCAFSLFLCGAIVIQSSSYTPPECRSDAGFISFPDSGAGGG
jgi:hypothetical protein